MRILLDTHILLWALATPERLGAEARAALEAVGNDVLFSAASIWEIAIKASLARPDFTVDAGQIAQVACESGLVELPVNASASARVATLAHHHRDPFDRLLIAQALDEPARLFTSDAQLAAYSELVVVLR